MLNKLLIVNNKGYHKVRICILCTLLVTLLGVTGCSKKIDKNKEAIQIVVQQMLNGPDDELLKLQDEMWKSNEEYEKKLKEMFLPYFTEKEYTRSIQISVFTEYHLYAKAKGHTIEVEGIDIGQSKKFKTNYDFTAHVLYGPADGEKKKLDVVGSAQFGEEEGKISFLQIFGKELMPEFQKK